MKKRGERGRRRRRREEGERKRRKGDLAKKVRVFGLILVKWFFFKGLVGGTSPNPRFEGYGVVKP